MYGTPVGPSKWTDAIELTAMNSWTAGRSASQCSAEIYAKHGVDITRNGIIGKAFRRGWKTPNAPRSNIDGVPKAERTAARYTSATPYLRTKARISRRVMRDREAIALEDYGSGERAPNVCGAMPRRSIATDAPASRDLMLLDLGPHDCRYATSPHESRQHLFCGATIADESSYCAHHLAVCHRRAG